ncbi:AGCS family alanine or glycine:cation symporter [Volucribacter psittacicida]|uniref:AGCS family alanine or glycine:cation symporter n=1 Tax=Volucribacter psittacicida TaxID=203482 RepID=A0A4R1G4E8_9PAST|nr:sodium:alanine symporter family protein [Volucribacter psittacicida]TCJ98511.1 AGCS family alanine or glycine:cation symporter [Volucribacter psittacicida]
MEKFHQFINQVNAPLWDIAIIALLATGLFFTITTGGVQIRLFAQSVREMFNGRNSADKNKESISAFQAFVIGLASRVGVGNVAGVALAITLGGPGAVFWMWVTAIIGMSSAFAESSLAQLFKVKDVNGQYRGGPAYYITQGLKQRWFGALFALSLIITYGFVFNAVQSNTIAEASQAAWGISPTVVGIALVILSAPMIFGGIKRISKIAEFLVPFMAILYIGMAVYILGKNISLVPEVIHYIIRSAFDFSAAASGFFAAFFSQAMIYGIKRGLYSNEAGMGSAPNAAASADVKHPVSQGMIQMLGVFVDTIIICTATAVIILLSGVHNDATTTGAQLTQLAIESQVGSWGKDFLAIIMFMFAFSTIIGNYAYAENNISYLKDNRLLLNVFRLLVLAMVYWGTTQKVMLVWDMADMFMGIMTLINLTAILLLAPIVWTLLKDYQQQLKQTKVPQFNIDKHPKLAKRVESDIWK